MPGLDPTLAGCPPGCAAQVLLEAGAAVSWRNRAGQTALHWAATNGNCLAIRTLLAAGAELQEADDNGDTALHYVATSGQVREAWCAAWCCGDNADLLGYIFWVR